jgi:Holliday junction resolvase-like predicted endonuclease
MYQLEVKRWLVAHKFPPSDGWSVTVDVDSMERGSHGTQPAGKKEIATECENWLRTQGVKIVAHPLFGRADLVAAKEGFGTFVVEVEGKSSRQKEQAMYSAIGQIVLSMKESRSDLHYAVATPDNSEWERQLLKVPEAVKQTLKLHLLLVSQEGVRVL